MLYFVKFEKDLFICQWCNVPEDWEHSVFLNIETKIWDKINEAGQEQSLKTLLRAGGRSTEIKRLKVS